MTLPLSDVTETVPDELEPDAPEPDAPEVLELPGEGLALIASEGSELAALDGAAAEGEAAKPQVARWFAVQVASSCEKKVKATLEQRAVTLGVSNRILEIEIPQTPGVKLKKDGSRQSI